MPMQLVVHSSRIMTHLLGKLHVQDCRLRMHFVSQMSVVEPPYISPALEDLQLQLKKVLLGACGGSLLLE